MKDHLEVSIIVPAYREAENIPVLIVRVFAALDAAGICGELIIVDDDSNDGTDRICKEFGKLWPLRLISRKDERGLATAVIRGLEAADGDILVVMDADLSHPPETIPALVSAARLDSVDFVVGSRYVSGGQVDETWGWIRSLNSRIATGLARGLTSIRDPMAGFFALSKETFQQADNLRPLGYKIGLELIVRCGGRRIVELPIQFQDRANGESKLDTTQQLLYLRHLQRLYSFKYPGIVRFLQFGVIGLSGMLVDLSLLTSLLPLVSLAVARAMSIWAAMTYNYLLNRQFTFRDHGESGSLAGYLRFCAACFLGAIVNWCVSIALCFSLTWFADQPAFAAMVGVAVSSCLNFVVCSRWVFTDKTTGQPNHAGPTRDLAPATTFAPAEALDSNHVSASVAIDHVNNGVHV